MRRLLERTGRGKRDCRWARRLSSRMMKSSLLLTTCVTNSSRDAQKAERLCERLSQTRRQESRAGQTGEGSFSFYHFRKHCKSWLRMRMSLLIILGRQCIRCLIIWEEKKDRFIQQSSAALQLWQPGAERTSLWDDKDGGAEMKPESESAQSCNQCQLQQCC